MTVELITLTEDILPVQDTPTHQSRLFATMKIKGGKDTKFQIDTGATCNVLKKSELNGTKYERKIKPTAQENLKCTIILPLTLSGNARFNCKIL